VRSKLHRRRTCTHATDDPPTPIETPAHVKDYLCAMYVRAAVRLARVHPPRAT